MMQRIRLLCLAALFAGTFIYRAAGAQDVPAPPVSNPATGQPDTTATPQPAAAPPVTSQPATQPTPDTTAQPATNNTEPTPAQPATGTAMPVPQPDTAAPSTPPPTPPSTPAEPTLAERSTPPAANPPAPAPSGQLLDKAWSLLTDNAAAGKNPNDRIQALGALSSMGSDDHAARLISDAFTSKEVDVRIAAILAATQTKNPRLQTRVREALDDPDPQVAFTAASALWKNKDHSGEDLLISIAEGDHKASESLMGGAKHKGQEEIHNPKLMATQGLEAGAGFVLGPAGFGIKALMYAKGQGGAAARAQAVELLSESHTEAAHRALADCINDKEAAVRAACVKGLGNWPGAETAKLAAPLMDDNKLPVRLCAAATYIRAERAEGPHRR